MNGAEFYLPHKKLFFINLLNNIMFVNKTNYSFSSLVNILAH